MGDAGFLVKWYVKKLYMVKTASLCVQSKRVSRKEEIRYEKKSTTFSCG